jgi:type IV pilus assembly protein PilB
MRTMMELMRRANLDHALFDEETQPKLGWLLLDKGLVTPGQLDEALSERRVQGGLLGEILVRLGFIFEPELARVLAEQAGVPFLNLEAVDVDPSAAATMPRSLGEALPALPVRFTPEGGLVIAVADPTDATLLPQLQLAINCPIVLAVATASSIRNGWRSAPTS